MEPKTSIPSPIVFIPANGSTKEWKDLNPKEWHECVKQNALSYPNRNKLRIGIINYGLCETVLKTTLEQFGSAENKDPEKFQIHYESISDIRKKHFSHLPVSLFSFSQEKISKNLSDETGTIAFGTMHQVLPNAHYNVVKISSTLENDFIDDISIALNYLTEIAHVQCICIACQFLPALQYQTPCIASLFSELKNCQEKNIAVFIPGPYITSPHKQILSFYLNSTHRGDFFIFDEMQKRFGVKIVGALDTKSENLLLCSVSLRADYYAPGQNVVSYKPKELDEKANYFFIEDAILASSSYQSTALVAADYMKSIWEKPPTQLSPIDLQYDKPLKFIVKIYPYHSFTYHPIYNWAKRSSISLEILEEYFNFQNPKHTAIQNIEKLVFCDLDILKTLKMNQRELIKIEELQKEFYTQIQQYCFSEQVWNKYCNPPLAKKKRLSDPVLEESSSKIQKTK